MVRVLAAPADEMLAHERPSAIAAAKKAFVMNAFGDATMALALFVLLQKTGTLDIPEVFRPAHGLGDWALNLIALGLLGGAVAKSAQVPLQTWLPDAMEGPTPVSALIHAATMVTAGVYLIARTHVFFELAPKVGDAAAVLGTVTLLLAGLIALVQVDIKRVIAYSTMSQIGYMFLGAGLGAYANGMFHLMTHAFFKALLFMGAGIVIHALAGEQDIRKMGGIARLLPRTWQAMLIGSLALVGIPPLAGFFSKDSILAAAMHRGAFGFSLWVIGLIGVFLTAVYAFRMLFIVFHGEPSPFVRGHFHALRRDVPGIALGAPVAVLAVLSVIGGWIQFAPIWTPVTSWLEPVAPTRAIAEATGWQEGISSALAVGLGALGIAVAWWIYALGRPVPRIAPLETLFARKFYFDEAYDLLFYAPADHTARGLAWLVERPLIGGSIAGVGALARGLGGRARELQTGLVRTYAFAIAASLAVVAVVFITVK